MRIMLAVCIIKQQILAVKQYETILIIIVFQYSVFESDFYIRKFKFPS